MGQTTLTIDLETTMQKEPVYRALFKDPLKYRWLMFCIAAMIYLSKFKDPSDTFRSLLEQSKNRIR